MSRTTIYTLFLLVALFKFNVSASTVVIATNQAIGFLDTSLDGADLVVSNCTLKVDGFHTLGSLQVVDGGRVTHSPADGAWVTNRLMISGEAHVLTSTNFEPLLASNVVISTILVTDLSGATVYMPGTDYQVSQSAQGLALVQLTVGSSIPEGSTNYFAYEAVQVFPTGGHLMVAGDVLVDAGSAIVLNGCGYAAGKGPGAGAVGTYGLGGSGAGHGGVGAGGFVVAGGVAYGSISAPTQIGSGGGSFVPLGTGGFGGGAMRLIVNGTLLVSGRISADGNAGVGDGSGGGAGGSLWITCGALAGDGVIRANGGAGAGTGALSAGGGAGGRICIEAGTDTFFGRMMAYGGAGGSGWGSAGTIYFQSGNQVPSLIVDNAGTPAGASWLTSPGYIDLTVKAATLKIAGALTLRNLAIGTNGSLLLTNQSLIVSNNATLQPGGVISVDGAGYPAEQGTGPGGRINTGTPFLITGGGHGGYGGGLGVTGGRAYGNAAWPVTLGSGGGGNSANVCVGGAGGGALRLIVTGTLDQGGTITANGRDGVIANGGGGAGGSIWVTAGTVSGAGSFVADGGSSQGGGGGGGGRISIESTNDLFSGMTIARGGWGTTPGGAGTVYRRMIGQFPRVTMDNDGRDGGNTILGAHPGGEVSISAGAKVVTTEMLFFSRLTIHSNGWFFATNLNLTVTNMIVYAGGNLVADGTSHIVPNLGAGKLVSTTNGVMGGGGGFGGNGGNARGGYPVGGPVYGSVLQETSRPGSSGGDGGKGGGFIYLSVSGSLIVDGVISANGNPGINLNSGGGSGGGIRISLGVLGGSGTIRANGGSGNRDGGGGGGGRIVVQYGTNLFSGLISAYGGDGFERGGPGTVYLDPAGPGASVFITDNGGIPGAHTTYSDNLGDSDVIVRGAAIVSFTSKTGNMLVQSNSWVIVTNNYFGSIVTEVERGGGIIANATGQLFGTGRGAFGGGGGYGGYGGNGRTNIPGGGLTYGSLTFPASAGSGGSAAPGGGQIRLEPRTLIVDGVILANGSDGFGGGSGGSIYINAGELRGTGVIAAEGGTGLNGGGGGGGGRIAIEYGTNLFTGKISAQGGDGYNRGGAGTIYLKSTQQNSGKVIVDNGGMTGANSGVTNGGAFDLLLTGGARLALTGSQSFSGLLIESNSWILANNSVFQINGNAVIASNSGILADGVATSGQANGSGSGPGGGGAGHGGSGGAGAGSPGGAVYGSLTNPTALGSSGGRTGGGAGGGVVRLLVNGGLTLDGLISTRGGTATIDNAGGGSGGSVFLGATSLIGNGVICADGGAGRALGSGGAGGRIAFEVPSRDFSGTVSAAGGTGFLSGGAGTIYWSPTPTNSGLVVVDNRGLKGANTPISLSTPMDLEIRDGGIVSASSNALVLDNLLVRSGGSLVSAGTTNALEISVLNSALVEHGGAIDADGAGYDSLQGPGTGASTNGIGSGAGHGGVGGDSSEAPGGSVYDSLEQPSLPGSAGGVGSGPVSAARGGGALHLQIHGSLALNGRISADGRNAMQQSGGGGSGGSVWIASRAMTGTGIILAQGGNGQLDYGGGGGGGRVALHTLENGFTGNISVAGGFGFQPGGSGSIYQTSSVPFQPEIVSQSPSGPVTYAVSNVDLTFSLPMDSASLGSGQVQLITPTGALANAALEIVALDASRFRLLFPPQIAEGTYLLTVDPEPQTIFGVSMAQSYVGAFSVMWQTLQGSVTNTNGQPVTGVSIAILSTTNSTVTDSAGFFTLKLPPGVDVSVFPSHPDWCFVPGMKTCSALGAPCANLSFTAVRTLIPGATSSRTETNLAFSWLGLESVTYQAEVSTNLLHWLPYASPVTGTNQQLQMTFPIDSATPGRFFRLRADNYTSE